MCRRWDRDGSGTLDLEEFLRALRVRLGCVITAKSLHPAARGAELSWAYLWQR